MKWDSEEDVRALDEASEENLRLWASYRGQTLTKTGMKSVGYTFVATRLLLLIIGGHFFFVYLLVHTCYLLLQ